MKLMGFVRTNFETNKTYATAFAHDLGFNFTT